MGRRSHASTRDRLANITVRHASGCTGTRCACRVSYVVRIRRGLNPLPAKTFNNKLEAMAWRDEVLANAGRPLASRTIEPAPTLEEIAISFIRAADAGEICSAKTVQPFAATTIAAYETALRKWVLPLKLPGSRTALGALPVTHIDQDVIEQILDQLHVAGASNETRRAAHAALRAMLNFAKRRGFITRVPAPVVLPKPSPGRSEIFEPDQVNKIMAAAHADDLARDRSFAVALIVVLYTSGGRITETLRLDFASGPSQPGLDLWSGRAVIRIPISHTKTAAGAREIPLDDEVREILLGHWNALGQPKMGTPVFPGTKTPRVHRAGAVRGLFARIKTATAITRITAHTFRHTHATGLLQAEVVPGDAAARIGHTDPAFTLSHYTHATATGQLAAPAQMVDLRRRQGVVLPPVPGAGSNRGETPKPGSDGLPTATRASSRRPPRDAEVS